MTIAPPELLVLADDASFEDIARAIEAIGLVRIDPTAGGLGQPAPLAIWTDGARSLYYAHDRATGLQTLAAPDGLPPGLSRTLPLMPTGAVAALEPILPLLADDRKARLQALRALPTGAGAAQPVVTRLIGGMLAHPDWELRASAMLSAARLGATALAGAIARLEFPEDPALGLGRHENRMLLALRDAALEMLGHGRDRRLPAGLIAAIGGDFSGLEPDVGAFVHSLVMPLPDRVPEPVPAPGVEFTAAGPQAADGQLLVWVPPMAYWLGHRAQPRGEPNAARRVDLPRGFYIEAEARAPALYPEAAAAAAARAHALGRPVRLPSSDEWEMAARGPDGRRFPWGQNPDRSLRVDLSPWGMADVVSGPGEWLAPEEPSTSPQVTAGADSILLSARAIGRPDRLYSFRFVYPIA